MKRVFSLLPQDFYADLFPRLAQHGIEVVLLSNSHHGKHGLEQFRSVLPRAELLSTFEMHAGKAPAHLQSSLRPASLADIEALAPWEGVAIQMMDRHNYYGVSQQTLRSIYLRWISAWKTLIDLHRPDAVLFHGTPHQGHDFVLYQLCKRAGIQTLMVDHTYLDECLYLIEDIEKVPHPTDHEVDAQLAGMPADVPGDTSVAANQFAAVNKGINDVRCIRRQLSWPWLLKELLHPRHLRTGGNRTVDSVYGLSQRRPPEIVCRWHEVVGRLRMRRALDYYERHARPPDLTTDFVFFPIHFQPERSTVPNGGRLYEQLHIVEMLAEALPSGWRLYVKEHPRQFRRGVLWQRVRDLDFYERLQSNPRVDLVPLDCPSDRLVERCRAVATIVGTGGWEAVQSGKPAVVFGYPWYLNCPGVHSVTSSDECAKVFRAIAAGEMDVDPRRVRAYAQVMRKSYTFRGCFSDSLLAMSSMSSAENTESYSTAIANAMGTSIAKQAAPAAAAATNGMESFSHKTDGSRV